MMGKLRWKLKPAATGLAAVCAGPRSSDLHDGMERFATVQALGRHAGRPGWFWYARNESRGVPLENTSHRPCNTVEEAKAEAMAYVKEHLAKAASCTPASSAQDH